MNTTAHRTSCRWAVWGAAAVLAVLACFAQASLSPALAQRVGETTKTNTPVQPGTDAGLTVNYATLADITSCLFGPGITVSNPVIVGDSHAFGTFSGGAGIIGIPSGVVMSSGDVAFVPGPNASDAITRDNGLGGDACLNGLIPGYSTFDAASLEFDFSCPGGTDLTIEYVFSSDEYNEWVNSSFNDVFGFFLDGCAPADNIAQVPAFCSSPGIPVSINNVNCDNPFGGLGVNCGCYINNDLSDGGGAVNTEMDGLTKVFTRTVHITPGTHHFKIAIADAGDRVLDSNVFLKCGGLACVCPDTLPPSGENLLASCAPVSDSVLCATLTWTAPADPSAQLDSSGTCVPVVVPATSYDVRYSSSPIANAADFAAATQAAGEPTPGAPGSSESMQICGLPEGTWYFAMVSQDLNGNASPMSTASATCKFNQPPDCSQAAACVATLWPPNHKYQPVSICGVTDPENDPITITVTGVTQDEPLNTRGDGNTCPDATIVGGQASVRAERTGTPGIPGNGRVYAITFTASDGDTFCTGTVFVCVPHDQGAHSTCIDDGQKYNSIGPCNGGGQLSQEITEVSLMVGEVTSTQAILEFALPNAGEVEMSVFDVAGRRLTTLANGTMEPGVYQRVWDMSGAKKGLYFVRLRTGAVTMSKTVVKLK